MAKKHTSGTNLTRQQRRDLGMRSLQLYLHEDIWKDLIELSKVLGKSRSQIVSDLIAREIKKREENSLAPYTLCAQRRSFMVPTPTQLRKRVSTMKNELSFNDLSELSTNDPKSLGECAERIHQAFVGAGHKPLSVLWPHNLITTWSTQEEARQAMEFLKSCWVPNLNMFPVGDVWIVELDVSWLQKLCS